MMRNPASTRKQVEKGKLLPTASSVSLSLSFVSTVSSSVSPQLFPWPPVSLRLSLSVPRFPTTTTITPPPAKRRRLAHHATGAIGGAREKGGEGGAPPRAAARPRFCRQNRPQSNSAVQ